MDQKSAERKERQESTPTLRSMRSREILFSIEPEVRMHIPFCRWIQNATGGLPTREIEFSPRETDGGEKRPPSNSASSEPEEGTLNLRNFSPTAQCPC